MSEVLEIVTELVLLVGLFWFAWIDYNTKWLPVVPLLALGFVGLSLKVLKKLTMNGQVDMEQIWQPVFWCEVTSGALVGLCLLVICILSQERIGKGDGLLFVVTGMYLDLMQNSLLLFRTLLLIGSFSLTCLMLKKREKDDRVAMGPFLLAAYVTLL